jgi:hypothetical protein
MIGAATLTRRKMMSKQPTATRFTQREESWARFLLDKIDKQINKREDQLERLGIPIELWDQDSILEDLYDDALFYSRYAQKMLEQREYIRDKYLGGE